MRSRLLIALAVVACLCSCARPASGELFLAAPRNSYDFPIMVEDTLSAYDFSFYTRMDGEERVAEALRLDISWASPADTTYRETVYMYAGDENGKLQRYRSDVRFPAAGEWTLRVSVSPQLGGFRGLGLVWKERRWDTTN